MRSSCCLVSPSFPAVTNEVCVVADAVDNVTEQDDDEEDAPAADEGIAVNDNDVNGDVVEETDEEEEEDDENVEVVEPVEELRGEEGFDFSPFIVYCIHAEAPGELASPGRMFTLHIETGYI